MEHLATIRERLLNLVLGAHDAVDLLLIAFLAKGHALLEGPPGIGKTALAQGLANAFGGTSKRLQFTPDLMPSDIIGYSLYQQNTGDFKFIKGPVFSHVLLADEINRTSPRVQSALLEAMNEQQVSVDGETYSLESPFFVIATQNNFNYTGTFPLPEPQLDRFLLSIPMCLPKREVQKEIILKASTPQNNKPILTIADILTYQKAAEEIVISDTRANYVVDLCEELRLLAGGLHTVSVRASLSLISAAKAKAYIEGRTYSTPDDVKYIFPYVMQHRLIGNDTMAAEALISKVLEQTSVD